MVYSIYYLTDACGNVPDHIPHDFCNDDVEKGRVRGTAYIHQSYYATLMADPTDPTLWATGITDKKIVVIPETIGSFDGGAPVDAPGYGRSSSRNAGFNMVLNFKDPGYKNNAAFYDAMAKSGRWHVAWNTETQSHISANPVRVIPKNPVAEDLESEMVWDVENRWSQGGVAAPFDTPPGIFVAFDYAP